MRLTINATTIGVDDEGVLCSTHNDKGPPQCNYIFICAAQSVSKSHHVALRFASIR